MPPRIYESARERILDAAEKLILERGVKQLTVDAVITEAMLSKGGFFHHFATKDALLVAIIERLVERLYVLGAEIAAKDPEPRGAMLRAQIALSFDEKTLATHANRALVLALIEAISSLPDVARSARAMNAEAFARDVGEDIPEGRSIAIQFALDGFWLSQAMGTAALTPGQRRALRDSLFALAQPEAGAGRRPRAKPAPKKPKPAPKKGKQK